MKRIFHGFLISVILFSLFLLTGCGKEAAPGNRGRISREFTVSQESLRSVPNAKGILDYSDLIIKSGLHVTDAVITEDDHILLVGYQEGNRTFTCSVLDYDLTDLSASTQRGAFFLAKPSEEEYIKPEIKFLTLEPLVLYDTYTLSFYTPEDRKTRTDLPPEINGGEPTVAGDRVFLSSWDGFLYEFTGEHTFEPVWTLPTAFYSMSTVYSAEEDHLIFQVYGPTDFEHREYFIRLDIRDWSMEAYTRRESMEWYCAGRLGNLVKVEYGYHDCTFALYRPAEEKELELSFPSELVSEEAWPSASRIPVNQTRGLFYTKVDHNLLENLYVGLISEAKASRWDPPGETAYHIPEYTPEYLTEQVTALEEKYGIRILIGSQLPDDSFGYTLVPTEDLRELSNALDILDQTLMLYPEGFFQDLSRGYLREMRFCFVKDLIPMDTRSSISNASAIAYTDNSVATVSFDIIDSSLTRGTIIHELSHVIDLRVNHYDPDFEEKWDSLNPPGFQYYYAYILEDGTDVQFSSNLEYTYMGMEYDDQPDMVYMIDAYSKTFPTEDRARLWEYLLEYDEAPWYYSSEHIQEKLSLYFREIRDCMDSEDWPEETLWETSLREAAGE